MRPPTAPLRFAALGDSLTEGVGDPVGGGWRGWAALLADGLTPAEVPVVFRNFAASGAQTSDVLARQLPGALAFAPDLVSVLVGVNDTLRATFDLHAVTARLDTVYGALTERDAVLLTACLPDPGALLGLPGVLARPLARRQRAVNSVVHALSARHGAVHLHAAEADWAADRGLRSADRLHPAERGHRQFAARFHAVLADAGQALGPAPDVEPERPAPTRAAALWWLATAGTGWVARRCADLLPQLLALAADEVRHGMRGTAARLDLRASAGIAAALASVPGLETALRGCDHGVGAAGAAPGTSRPCEVCL
ncbi:SGNH/GDSL hydrolase family protein [Streptomyces sp. WG-D5]